MLQWIIVGTLALTPSVVTAAECMTGSSEVMRVEQWEAFSEGNGVDARVGATVQVVSDLPNTTRMVRGYVDFRDALGRIIADMLLLPPDAVIEPGTPVVLALGTTPLGKRLMSVNKADVIPTLCLRSVVYEDGTKEEF